MCNNIEQINTVRSIDFDINNIQMYVCQFIVVGKKKYKERHRKAHRMKAFSHNPKSKHVPDEGGGSASQHSVSAPWTV